MKGPIYLTQLIVLECKESNLESNAIALIY